MVWHFQWPLSEADLGQYISGHNLANTYFKSDKTKSIFSLIHVSYSHFTSF